MTGIVLLVGKIGIALGGFVGTSYALNWYNKDKDKGGKRHDKNDLPFSHKR